jgi:hypothetical protein
MIVEQLEPRQLLTGTPPTVDAPTHANVTATTATLGETIENLGDGASISGGGIVYSLTSDNANPHFGDPDVNEVAFTSPGVGTPSTVGVTGLTPGAQYSFTAYGTNNNSETGSSSADTFTTPALANPPTVTTPTSTAITATTATLGGNVTSDGGDALTR